jgi:DNA-binding LacI/PurR family transcriptional regulator
MMTLGALEGIHAAGARIPDEVSVVAFDDMPRALALTPPLTVVRQPSYELGERALELLLQRIRDPGRSTATMLLEAAVIVRSSTAAPPG